MEVDHEKSPSHEGFHDEFGCIKSNGKIVHIENIENLPLRVPHRG